MCNGVIIDDRPKSLLLPNILLLSRPPAGISADWFPTGRHTLIAQTPKVALAAYLLTKVRSSKCLMYAYCYCASICPCFMSLFLHGRCRYLSVLCFLYSFFILSYLIAALCFTLFKTHVRSAQDQPLEAVPPPTLCTRVLQVMIWFLPTLLALCLGLATGFCCLPITLLLRRGNCEEAFNDGFSVGAIPIICITLLIFLIVDCVWCPLVGLGMLLLAACRCPGGECSSSRISRYSLLVFALSAFMNVWIPFVGCMLLFHALLAAPLLLSPLLAPSRPTLLSCFLHLVSGIHYILVEDLSTFFPKISCYCGSYGDQLHRIFTRESARFCAQLHLLGSNGGCSIGFEWLAIRS